MSGNGDGQRHEGDANFGNATEILKYMGGDNRAAFLGPEKTSMLYKWMMYEKYELLQNTCSILPKSMGANSKDRTANAFVLATSGAGLVTASGERSKRKAQQQEFELMKLQRVLDHSFDRFTKTTVSAPAPAPSNVSTVRATTQAEDYELLTKMEARLFELLEKSQSDVIANNPTLKVKYLQRIMEAEDRLNAAEASYKNKYEMNQE